MGAKNNEKYSIDFLMKIAERYNTMEPVADIAADFGTTAASIHNMMQYHGLNKGRKTIAGRWELVQAQNVFTENFFVLKTTSIAQRTNRKAKAAVKKNLISSLPYELFIVMKSEANTQDQDKLSPVEAKQKIAEILEKVDRHETTTVSGYAKIACVIDSLATGTPTDEYKPFGGHTKAESLCWLNAGPDEPVFVLRAQDKTAPAAILHWIQSNVNNVLMPDAKLMEAFDTMLAMRSWRERKFPD